MQTCRQNVVNMYEHVVFYHVLPDESAWDDGNGADMAHRFLTLWIPVDLVNEIGFQGAIGKIAIYDSTTISSIYTDTIQLQQTISNNSTQFLHILTHFHSHTLRGLKFSATTFWALLAEMPGWNTHQHCEECARKCRRKRQQSEPPVSINKGRFFFV